MFKMQFPRPQFEHFPLSRSQVRSLQEEKQQLTKQLSQNRSEMEQISRKNMQQVGVYFQRLRERHEIINTKLTRTCEILRTHEQLAGKQKIEIKNNEKQKNKSHELINQYKFAIEDKKNKEDTFKRTQQAEELKYVEFNNIIAENQRRKQDLHKMQKKKILQQQLQQKSQDFYSGNGEDPSRSYRKSNLQYQQNRQQYTNQPNNTYKNSGEFQKFAMIGRNSLYHS